MVNSKEEFWSHVNIKSSDECWEWKLYITRKGYGQVRYKNILTKAHRISYKLFYNEDIDGKIIMHICDNPSCCNPKHLKLGTQKDNIEDRHNKKRDFIPFGSKNNKSKVKEEDVLKIRELYKTGKYKQIELSKMFGINYRTISYIINKKTWRHLK